MPPPGFRARISMFQGNTVLGLPYARPGIRTAGIEIAGMDRLNDFRKRHEASLFRGRWWDRCHSSLMVLLPDYRSNTAPTVWHIWQIQRKR